MIARNEQLRTAECNIDAVGAWIVEKCRVGMAVGQGGIRTKSVGVGCIIYRIFATAKNDTVTRQANHSLNYLRAVRLATGCEVILVDDYDVTAVWYVLVANNSCPGAGTLPDYEPVTVLEGVLHAVSIYLVALEYK